MKYTLVLTVDNAVFLGEHLDEDGEEIEDNKFEVSYDKLDDIDKNKKIAFLNKKDDRNSSNQFVASGTASKLKSMIEDYKAGLLILSNGDKNMIKEILSSLNTDDLDKESWERYNFYDMPAVGALTLLSKWQADVRGIHLSVRSHIGDMLQEASGGYFPSTSHRVINPEGSDASKSRISLPLFLHPRSEVKLSERHTQHSYLLERLRELGVKV